jgi:hypothetical protein
VVAVAADSAVLRYLQDYLVVQVAEHQDEATQPVVLALAAHLCKVSTVVDQELVLQQEQVPAAAGVAHQRQEQTPTQLLQVLAETDCNHL